MKQARLLAFTLLAMLSSRPASASDLVDPETFRILASEAPAIDLEVLESALSAAECAQENALARRDILTVIDYSIPSTEQRLWVFDLARKKLLYRELVAHGVNTGENMATEFSNIEGSRQSSLGLFLTDQTYVGRNGYSLKLHGLELGVNHLALERTIVIHGAWYVSDEFHQEHGRLGRSWGCPALDKRIAKSLIDTIKNGSLLFVYYPDDAWLSSSSYLNACTPDERLTDTGARSQALPAAK